MERREIIRDLNTSNHEINRSFCCSYFYPHLISFRSRDPINVISITLLFTLISISTKTLNARERERQRETEIEMLETSGEF